MKRMRWLALASVFALVVAACGGSETGESTTTAGGTTTTTGGTTTSVEPDPNFEGLVLDAGGCDYGGRVNTITAVDQYTVEFALCGPHPAFLAQIAFGVFGIQPEEHLEATGGAPLDNPIGTGPYSLKEWVRGDSVVYERFDDYYGTPAAAQTLSLIHI